MTFLKIFLRLALIACLIFTATLASELSDNDYNMQSIQQAFKSDSRVSCNFTKYKLIANNKSEVLDIPKVTINSKQDLTNFMELLDCFPSLKKVNMYSCKLSKLAMDTLFDTYSNIDFAWTLKFGKREITTDIIAYSSKHGTNSTRFREDYYNNFRFCKNLQALDLGHNMIGNIDFISNLTELKILILADNSIVDISPLKKLKKLEYLEMFRNRVSDISVLESLTELKDINFCYNRIKDITALLGLNNLERAWLSHNGLDTDMQNLLKQSLPNLQTNFVVHSPTSDGWRDHLRYFEVKKIFK